MEGRTYEEACDSFRDVIGKEAMRFPFLETSGKLTVQQRSMYQALVSVDQTGLFTMSDGALKTSLQTLSLLLSTHYDDKVIILIDEYDVPLDKAFRAGYYDKMISLIRNMFSSVLKSNNSLQFAVMTGCMRISRESIFTGLNNLRVLSITDVRFDEYFGFMDREVQDLLDYYDLSGSFNLIKVWYDGYQFGCTDVYCPWDVLNYCDLLRSNPEAQPQNYWTNTSSNDVVKRFIQEMDKGQTKREIERLIAGEIITKEIHQELTYQDMYTTIDNLRSVLFTTGRSISGSFLYSIERRRCSKNRGAVWHISEENHQYS
ncbi:AAA family ATPase [Blautia sp. HCP3S3_G3]|uniref:AAA family ATPase n=1 Tax=Blautia sp. HCP3S3_G3 TaxID=3438913 RepID=UPI003F8C5F60